MAVVSVKILEERIEVSGGGNIELLVVVVTGGGILTECS